MRPRWASSSLTSCSTHWQLTQRQRAALVLRFYDDSMTAHRRCAALADPQPFAR